jgi:hypothetical protein
MTAGVKIPVATADNVTAVPLSAVFTEKNPDTDQMERFVYVQHGDSFEKRNVKIGVADFFFAEVQEGLTPGETVSLELPKEELEKKTRLIAGQGPKGESGAARLRTSGLSTPARTNSTTTLGTANPLPTTPAKVIPAASPAVAREASSGKSS